MAGHSHWANIKRKKEAQDKKKSAVFSKAAKMILTAIKEGGVNPETNNALRIAIAFARQVRMPNANIERLIKREANKDPSKYKEVLYEGLYHNIPVLMRALTDNTNRTINDIKQVFNEFGARLVEKGAVSWQFEQVGVIVVSLESDNFEETEMQILELFDVIDFAEESTSKNHILRIYVNRDKLKEFTDILQAKNFEVVESRLHFIFNGAKPNVDEEIKKKLKVLIGKILDLDDITDMWTAFDK